jgi:hypothetical protein
MLGLVAPHDDGEERRLLLPPPGDGDPEHGPDDAALGVADLGLVGEVAGEADARLGHGAALLGLSGRAVCPALGTGDGGRRGMQREPQGQAAEPTKSARLDKTADRWSARVPGWLVECLRLGVGHASTVRPDPSTLGVVGERGSHRERCLQLVPGSAVWTWRSSSSGPLLAVQSLVRGFRRRRAHPKAIQAHLGHSSIQVTMDRYGHLFPDALEQLADRLDAARAAARTDPVRTEPQTDVVELPARQAADGA